MKKRITRIAIGAAIYIAALLLPDSPQGLKLGAFIAAYAVIGYRVVWNALRGILRGQMLDENFLMSIATRKLNRGLLCRRIPGSRGGNAVLSGGRNI